MVKVEWTREAIEDIHELREYFELRSVRYAEELTDKVFEKADVLAKYPRAGRVVPELANDEIRELLFKTYRIIYKIVSESQIDILAVHSGLKPLSERSIFD